MIKLSRLDRQEFAINCDLIAWVEARPDTVVRLVSGESLIVRESVDEIIRRVAAYRSEVLRNAGLESLLAGGIGCGTVVTAVRDELALDLVGARS